MWAHPRSISTAFLRMMIERGDLWVVHEPLVTLTDWNEVPIPDGAGGQTVAHTADEVFAALFRLAQTRPVFFKDTVEYHYHYMFEHPELVARMRHTLIVRHPAATINSHHFAKPTVACHEIGYEHLHRLFGMINEVTGEPPVVLSAEALLADPAGVVSRYCAAVGLPFLEHALRWPAQDRPEWQRTRQWHLDVIDSTGFAEPRHQYPVTIDNDSRLRSYYDYHYPYYEELIRHAL
jgi:hypothetical protein